MASNETKRYRKKGLILSALFSACMVAIASLSYATYAWFASKRTATVNFASMQVGPGLSYKIRYFNSNQVTSSGNYNGYDLTTVDTLVSSTSTYDALFSDLSSDSTTQAKQLGAGCVFSPKYASTYAIEITNGNNNATKLGVYLKSFTAPQSETKFHDSSMSDTSLAGSAFSLAEAYAVYTGFSLETDLNSNMRYFLTGDTTNLADARTSRFSHKLPATLTSPEDWSSSNMSTLSLAGNATAYFFVTFYFSNADTTFYKEASNDGTNTYYVPTSDGNSNVYESLTIAFPEVIINPE